MSEIFEKDGHFFRACMFCENDVLIHSMSGNAYSMAVHNSPRTDVMCFDCAKQVGAARNKRDFDEYFILEGKLFYAYTDYWLTWKTPEPEDFEVLSLKDYGVFIRSVPTAESGQG